MNIEIFDIKKITITKPEKIIIKFYRDITIETKSGEILTLSLFDKDVKKLMIKKQK